MLTSKNWGATKLGSFWCLSKLWQCWLSLCQTPPVSFLWNLGLDKNTLKKAAGHRISSKWRDFGTGECFQSKMGCFTDFDNIFWNLVGTSNHQPHYLMLIATNLLVRDNGLLFRSAPDKSGLGRVRCTAVTERNGRSSLVDNWKRVTGWMATWEFWTFS